LKEKTLFGWGGGKVEVVGGGERVVDNNGRKNGTKNILQGGGARWQQLIGLQPGEPQMFLHRKREGGGTGRCGGGRRKGKQKRIPGNRRR